MRTLSCIAVIAAALGGVGLAEAQTVEAQVGGQGEATVTIGQPPPPDQGTVYVAPPGYGQPAYPQQQQVYVQPQYQQPMYQQVQPAQPRYEDREDDIPALWITGVVLFPVSYLFTAIAATSTQDCVFGSTCRDGDYLLFSWIPLVGPWFMLAQNDTRELNAEEITGAFFGGLAQVTGLTLIILGFALRRTVRVATYALDRSERSPQLAFNVIGGPTQASVGLTLTHF